MKLQIQISWSGQIIEVDAEAYSTVEDIKRSLSKKTGLYTETIHLINLYGHTFQRLENDRPIVSYNISDFSQLYIV